MSDIQVDKYGGSSLRDSQGTLLALNETQRVFESGTRLVQVVSAPGKRHTHGLKMTDLVREATLKYFIGEHFSPDCLNQIREHFQSIFVPLGLDHQRVIQTVDQIFLSRLNQNPKHPSVSDLSSKRNQVCYAALLSAPESINAQLHVLALQARGLPAVLLDPQENIMCGGDILNAQYQAEASIPLIRQAFDRCQGLAVRPGFQGRTREGQVALFPRGGSDITGSIDAEALGVKLYRNCTDVHGVKQVDPRLFQDQPHIQSQIKTIAHLTYEEVEELAISGASVIHPLAIAPLIRGKIPMRICHSQDLQGTHTLVSAVDNSPASIKGLAYLRGLGYLVLHSPNMIGEPGYLETFSEAFRKHQVDIEMVFTSPTIIAANTKDVEKLPDVVETLKSWGHVYCGSDTGMVSIVGHGYGGQAHVAIRFLSAIQTLGLPVTIRRQTQAMTSSYWISVDDPAVEPLARAVYHRFFGQDRDQKFMVEC